MTEKQIKNILEKMGYSLSRKTFPTAGNGKEIRYAIIDQNNVLVAGEYTMYLDDVEEWINSEN